MLIFQQSCQRMGEWLGFVVAGLRVQGHINLHALRAGGLRKTLQLEMIEDRAQPHCNLTALNDVRRRPGIKVKDKRARAFDICCQRQRWMQFDGREIRYPYQRGEIVCQNVIYVSLIPLTPNGRSLHPVWAMLGRIFFEERWLVYTIWIAFES